MLVFTTLIRWRGHSSGPGYATGQRPRLMQRDMGIELAARYELSTLLTLPKHGL